MKDDPTGIVSVRSWRRATPIVGHIESGGRATMITVRMSVMMFRQVADLAKRDDVPFAEAARRLIERGLTP